MLSEAHTERDYEAVMESRERLRRGSPHGWPREGFTLAENRADLIRHEREFLECVAFAYTVLSLDEQRVLGCVYINPPGVADKGADVYLWLRDSEHATGLAYTLYRRVDEWLLDDWPLQNINYTRTGYYLIRGSCLCGSVTFTVGDICGPFELCHCARCRRATGSAFAAMVGVTSVHFHSGIEQVRRIALPVRDHPPGYRRCFCERCGAPTPDPGEPGAQEIPAGVLENLHSSPERHIYIDGNVTWAEIRDDLPQFTGAEIHRFRKKEITP